MKLQKILKIAALMTLVLSMCLMFAGCMPAAEGAEGTTDPAGSYTYLIMFGVIIVVFYFFMIRPENKRKKKLQEMRDSLAVGDDITTIGGIVGKVVHISDDSVTFETGEDRVRMKVTRWAISTVSKKGESAE